MKANNRQKTCCAQSLPVRHRLIGIALCLATSFAPAHQPHDSIATLTAGARALADADADSFRDIVSSIAASPGFDVYHIALAPEAESQGATGQRRSPPQRIQAFGDPGAIAVIYPDIGEPYRSVFIKIIDGIEESVRARITTLPVGPNRTAADVADELRRKDIKVVIALGRQGLKAVSGLDREIGVIASGVLSAPPEEGKSIPVFSLTPDPALLFTRLKSLAPAVRRIHVVYESRQNSWLITLARDAARNQGYELATYEVVDLKNAVRQYQDIFASIDPRREAVWLPQDSTTADEATILPLVLQEAWTRNIPVFSSSVGHVRRGALFALYPNNAELGRNLASSAKGYLSGSIGKRSGTTPLREVLAAVNLRTAGHLGLESAARQQNFDLVFPEP